MSLENDIVMRDIMKASLDLEEALEASRYISHPYSTHPSEDTWLGLLESYVVFDSYNVWMLIGRFI
ncbi:hypothetical protein Hanom_Chr12g01087961 [Helianthus anomalus]